jgi:uncharacterized membrane protein
MSKNIDLLQILSLVLIGMFIPFFISILVIFGINITNIDNLYKVLLTFLYFLLIFGIEIIIVYLYFRITNKIANNRIDKLKKR